MQKTLLKLLKFMSVQAVLIMTFQIVAIQFLVAGDLNGQNLKTTKLSLDFENKTLTEVFSLIEDETSYVFVYSTDVRNSIALFSLNVKDESLENVLFKLRAAAKLKFKVVDYTITAAFDPNFKSGKPVTSLSAVSPPINVSGVVKDETNTALPGVNVLVKGTTNGTSTDAEGKYALTVPDENSVLTFSFIGYETIDIPVGTKTVIDVTLKPDLTTLNEIVVVGYGSQERRDVTGSVGKVKTEQLTSLPVPSIGDALAGRAAGLHVISNGQPGSDPMFVIRGATTINNTQPLLVIDGFPTTSGLNSLNPADIESIQILKDASSSAIYGSRAANGVVIVTTKRGKTSKPRFEVNYFKAFQEPTNMIEVLDAKEFAEYSNDMLTRAGNVPNPLWADPASLGEGSDWVGEYFRTAPMDNLSVSFSGSNDKSNYFVSGNYLNHEGIIINNGFKRYTMQFNADHDLFERLRFGHNLTFNHDLKRNTGANDQLRNVFGALPTQTIRNADGSFTNQLTPGEYYGTIDNPIARVMIPENKTTGYNLIGGLYVELDLLKDLKFRTNAGVQANFWDDFNWNPRHEYTQFPTDTTTLSRNFNKAIGWLWDNTLTYSHTFNQDHELTALVGTSAQEKSTENVWGQRIGYFSEQTQVLDAGSSGVRQQRSGGSFDDWALFSYFFRANYGFRDKYLLTATIRRDASTKFGPDHRWGTFPSVSAKWRISAEPFFQNISIFNELSFRAGYGETGNQEFNKSKNYLYNPGLEIADYSFNGNPVTIVYPVTMPNHGLHWESVKQTNVGFDAEVFKNRVSVSADYFNKVTTNMLVRGPVNITSGYDNENANNRPVVNAGEVLNRGFELNIGSRNMVGVVTWDTDVNFTFLQNQIVDLNDTIPMKVNEVRFQQFASQYEAGHPINAFFGYVTDGIFQSQEEVDAHAFQSNATSAGDIRFKDLNNDGVITPDDRKYLGDPNPNIIVSLGNRLAYKGFDFSFFFVGEFGKQLFNFNKMELEGMDAARNQSVEILNRWTEGNTNTDMPRAVFSDPATNNRISDRYIESGDFVRVKNVTLGYTLPASVISKAKLSSLRFYTSVQNLHTFTNYSGIDPEIGFNGIDNNVYPLTRTYSFGVNLSF